MTSLCIKPACGDNCCGCNSALTPEQVAQYAKRYVWLRDHAEPADWEFLGYQNTGSIDATIDDWMAKTPNAGGQERR